MIRQSRLIIGLLLGFNWISFHGNAQVSEEFKTEMTETLRTLSESNNLNGISVSVRLLGKGDWSQTIGNSHQDVKLDSSFYFGIASNTKLFTSVMCLKMVENGLIRLDDRVGDWLDEYPNIHSEATIKQILQHQSGHNDYTNNFDLLLGEIQNNPLRVWTPEEVLAQVGEPVGQPGEIVFYSNTNYILAAMILEKATGSFFHELVRDSILIPFGLNEFYFEGFEIIPEPYAHPYVFTSDYSAIPRTALGTLTWSAGCMVSRPMEMLDWYEILFRGEIINEQSLSSLMDFIEWPEDMDGSRMGLGIYEVNEGDKQYYGHGGRTIGYASYTLFDPECEAIISVMINETISDPRSIAVDLGTKLCSLLETSINEFSSGNSLVSVYPNPLENLTKVSAGQDDLIKNVLLFNASGSVIRNYQNCDCNSLQVNFVGLSSGVYFLRVQLESGKYITQKVLKIDK